MLNATMRRSPRAGVRGRKDVPPQIIEHEESQQGTAEREQELRLPRRQVQRRRDCFEELAERFLSGWGGA